MAMLLRSMFSTILIITLIGLPGAVFGDSNTKSEPLEFSSPEYEIEDLTAEFFPEGSVIVVSGKVRNKSNVLVRGHVVVYFLNENNETVYAVEAEVNRSLPLVQGKTGSFKVGANIKQHPGISNVSVEFFDRI